MSRILVTGGTGFIGRRLVQELLRRGDAVTVLSRDPKKGRKHLPRAVRVVAWDPYKEGAWYEEIEVVDAVVHLAGELVAKRWTDETKKRIEASRVDTTRHLVEAIGRAKKKPAVLVSASATGYYGPHAPNEELDETAPAGKGFLPGVVEKWEEAAREAETHGVRSVQLRLGIVLGEGGGALSRMVLPFKLGVGGPVGDGTQAVSWVHVDDVVGMILFAIEKPEMKGAVNCTSPYSTTGEELAEALGVVLDKSAWFRAPQALLKLAYGEAAEILTTGQRVYPRRAVELGYEFRQARLLRALESTLGEAASS